jgi:hypothetical protein
MARRWVVVDCGCGRRVGRVTLAEGVSSDLDSSTFGGMVADSGRWGTVLGKGTGGVSLGNTVWVRCPGCHADTRVKIARFGRSWLAAWDGDRVMVVDPSGWLSGAE